MNIKKIFATLVASAVAVTTMAVSVFAAEEVAFTGTYTVKSTGNWWDQADLTMTDFIGETDPATVTKIVVSVDKAAAFTYNGATANGYTKVDLTDGGTVEVTDLWLDDNYFVGLAVSSGDATYASTFTWEVYADSAAAPAEDATTEEAATEEAPAEDAAVEEVEEIAEETEEVAVEEDTAEEVVEEDTAEEVVEEDTAVEEAPVVEEAPAADTTTPVAATGNTTAAAIVAVMAVAGAAAVASKRK